MLFGLALAILLFLFGRALYRVGDVDDLDELGRIRADMQRERALFVERLAEVFGYATPSPSGPPLPDSDSLPPVEQSRAFSPAPASPMRYSPDGVYETQDDYYIRLAGAIKLVVSSGRAERSCMNCGSMMVTPALQAIAGNIGSPSPTFVFHLTCVNCGAEMDATAEPFSATCIAAAECWDNGWAAHATVQDAPSDASDLDEDT